METNKYLENMAATATLVEAGLAMMRENVRRRHTKACGRTVDDLLAAWMRREDDPMPGDTVGIVRFRANIK